MDTIGPKGTFDIGLDTHKTIFQILCETLKEANLKYGNYVPWYIMTSNQNNEDTIKFFEENNYFNYPKEKISFFIQGELPMINEQGKILLDTNGLIKEAADGHGGIFESLRKNGIIYDMEQRGVKWAYIGGVDNILAKMVDPIFVGIIKDKNLYAGGKSLVKAYPEEKVGVFCKKNGRPSVIEYSEMPKEMAEEKDENGNLKYAESHILCNLFNVEEINKISKNKLPYHYAHKKADYMDENGNIVIADKPNAYKFESFLFDAFQDLDDMVIMRVNRNEEFAPIKNAQGVDSPETARKLYKDFYNL